MNNRLFIHPSVCLSLALFFSFVAGNAYAANVIEEKLAEIGTVPNEEIMVVQRKFTRKLWRSEVTPVSIGAIPFGTIRRTLFGGANYTLHVNDWFAWEVGNFVYSRTFFSSFTDDINTGQNAASQPQLDVDTRKLLFLFTTGIQLTPSYGKVGTFSRWILYTEPFVSFGLGMAKTEDASYATFYPGVGLRFFFKEWFSMKVEFRDYMFTEKVLDRATGDTQNKFRQNYAFTVALSFWFPKMPGK